MGLRFLLYSALAGMIVIYCQPVKIACLGDSITQGRAGTENTPGLNSYRYPLWLKLDSAGYRCTFVGSTDLLFKEDLNHRVRYLPSPYTRHKFEAFHEGHWGWRTGDIIDSLYYWLAGYKPDIVLIHLGDNDVNAKVDSAGIAQNLKSIIGMLRLKNPDVKILLAQLITVWCTQVNHAVPLIAKKISTRRSPVIVVDLATGFINNPKLPGALTVDWVHPNESGERWMAQRWYDALVPLLGRNH